ncbi:BON domain-containing protein [Dyella sp. 20L07]|uniref:BON domain-containing protein n=1 Tax=Dyella sp. 20L07 TaxID=3384240 RepID=UPI003D2653E8
MNKTIRRLTMATGIAIALGAATVSMADDMKAPTTASEQIADARRESQISTAFSVNPHLSGFDLSVTVAGNRAVLGGRVEDSVARDLAGQIALGVDGIKRVDNHIAIDPNYTRAADNTSSQSFGEKVADANITASIKSKLLWNALTEGLDIHVDTNQGKVTLTGTVNTSDDRSLAARIAADTEGVIGVDNTIAVSHEADVHSKLEATQRRDANDLTDTWITTKVKSSLMLTRSVQSFDIQVTTVHGVVTLNGIVDTATERALATQVTQDIRGVKKVETGGLKVG